MRLTEKYKEDYVAKNNCKYAYEIYQKLGQLEDILEGHNIETLKELDGLLWYVKQIKDIEKELGIDLVTLFKAFKNGIWIKHNLGSRTYNYKTGDQIIFHKAPYKTLAENIGYFRRLFEKEFAQNYGKTWALTKEELK